MKHLSLGTGVNANGLEDAHLSHLLVDKTSHKTLSRWLWHGWSICMEYQTNQTSCLTLLENYIKLVLDWAKVYLVAVLVEEYFSCIYLE